MTVYNKVRSKCSPSILYRWGFFWGKTKERYGKCNTIVIGKFAGKENAFLIQNVFSIIEKYLDHVHTIQGQPIVVHKELNKILNKNLQDVLAMYVIRELNCCLQMCRNIADKSDCKNKDNWYNGCGKYAFMKAK